MPDLAPTIRTFILADTDLVSNLTTYNSQKAVFTRRPVPTDAEYPLMVISPQITASENDYLTNERRTAVYDITVYGQNDTSVNYRAVEETAYKLAAKFNRLTDLVLPTGYTLIQAVGLGPIPAPTDDDQKIARLVSVTFDIVTTDKFDG